MNKKSGGGGEEEEEEEEELRFLYNKARRAFPLSTGGDTKGISAYIHLYRFGRCGCPLLGMTLLLLLLLLSTQTYSRCHGNGFIYIDILTCMCVIYELVWW